MKKLTLLLALWSLAVYAPRVEAFPELVRRGYANCITCHYSPSGGGLITAYGRALSSEVLSMAGKEGEGDFLYGAVKLPEEVGLGGDFRFGQTFLNMPAATSAKFILMQADVEGALSLNKFTAVATGGVDYNGDPISRRHYVVYHALDELSVRIGKFAPAYGLNTENHTISIKRGLGKDQATESYNAEAAWIGEKLNFYATGIAGRPDNQSLGVESGFAATGSLFFAERFKAGLSYFYGNRSQSRRHMGGPFAILGFTPRLFLMAELDFQSVAVDGNASQTGLADYLRFDYEVLQGLHCYLVQEISRLGGTNLYKSYGGGIQVFPRPHYELNSMIQKITFSDNDSASGTLIWLLGHFYL